MNDNTNIRIPTLWRDMVPYVLLPRSIAPIQGILQGFFCMTTSKGSPYTHHYRFLILKTVDSGLLAAVGRRVPFPAL
jgi:hypothetical protein